MKNSFNLFAFFSILIVSVALLSCEKDKNSNIMTTHTITDVASSNPNFSTLELALKRAGLDVTLANPASSLTVFAPTNAAFTALLTELGVASLNDCLLYTSDAA